MQTLLRHLILAHRASPMDCTIRLLFPSFGRRNKICAYERHGEWRPLYGWSSGPATLLGGLVGHFGGGPPGRQEDNRTVFQQCWTNNPCQVLIEVAHANKRQIQTMISTYSTLRTTGFLGTTHNHLLKTAVLKKVMNIGQLYMCCDIVMTPVVQSEADVHFMSSQNESVACQKGMWLFLL